MYRVIWHWPGQERDGAFLDLANSVHFDSPKISMPEPWIGPLCACELRVLRGESNEQSLSKCWSFEVELLFDGETARVGPSEHDLALVEVRRLLAEARQITTPIEASLELLRRARESMAVHALTEAEVAG